MVLFFLLFLSDLGIVFTVASCNKLDSLLVFSYIDNGYIEMICFFSFLKIETACKIVSL